MAPNSRERSYLYVPADRPDRLAKVAERGADAVIVDLEDAVAEHDEASVLAQVGRWLDVPPAGPKIWVRIKPGSAGLTEIAALASRPAIKGFYLAKTNDADFVIAAVAAMRDQGREPAVVPILESARAVLAAPALAALPGVVRLQLGEADLRADLGVTLSADERELLAVRSTLVLASAAAGLPAPVAPVDVDYRDEDGFAYRTQLLKQLGFFGRACIHPKQVAIVNRIFHPTNAEVQQARAVLDALDASGGAATIGPEGTMIDAAVARWAHRILANSD